MRWSGGNSILTLNNAARKMAGGDMLEGNIPLERAKQRDARTDEHRNTGDDEPLYQAGLQKPLDREPAIDIDMLDAACLEL